MEFDFNNRNKANLVFFVKKTLKIFLIFKISLILSIDLLNVFIYYPRFNNANQYFN